MSQGYAPLLVANSLGAWQFAVAAPEQGAGQDTVLRLPSRHGFFPWEAVPAAL